MHSRQLIGNTLYAPLFLVFFLLPNSARAQWTEPVQISSFEYGLLNARLSIAGDTIHVVGDGGVALYYLRSTNNGRTWTEPVCPADTFQGSDMPDILCGNGYVHFVGVIYFIGERQKVFHFSSSDGGVSWSESHLVFDESDGFLKYPRLAVSGDTIFVSYVTSQFLWVSVSYDNGQTWYGPYQVDYGGGYCLNAFPAFYYAGGRLHLIYELAVPDDTTGIEIYYCKSDDYGISWANRYCLSTPENSQEGKYGQAPSAYLDPQGHIICLWFDYKYGSACGVTGDILGRVSLDNGESWLPETRLTYTQTGANSSCLILGDKIQALWMDYGYYYCDDPKIMYSVSTDWGESWTESELISGEIERADCAPDLDYNINLGDTLLHCIFDGRYPSVGCALFYNRSQELVSIKNEESNPRPVFLNLKAYPNPFNSSTTITYANLPSGAICIYNIAGQKVATLPASGEVGEVTWDGTDGSGAPVSSGIYFVRANGATGAQTIKLVYLK